MEGIIVGQISNDYWVEVGQEEIWCKPRGKMKKDSISPLVGDRVEIELVDAEKKQGVIETIKPRTNEIKRPKLSNLSQVILVVSLKSPSPDFLLLDKQLAYLEYKEIKPVIVLNKEDLIEKEEEIKEIYQKIGYPVLTTSAKEKKGIEELRQVLQGNISAFAGNSGVGKSSLLNTIYKEEVTQQGEISIRNQRGKNTTTAVRLYQLETDAYIADTPGFSTFSLEEIPSKELENYFAEFRKWINQCEFVGCNHEKEENCGIKKAIQEGEISLRRYQNYIKIKEELRKREERRW